MKYTVEYFPPISEEGEKIIKENVNPSMTSEDGDGLYYLDLIMENDVKELLPKEDVNLLEILMNTEHIDYIEI